MCDKVLKKQLIALQDTDLGIEYVFVPSEHDPATNGEGVARKYNLYFPGLSAEKPASALVVFHGDYPFAPPLVVFSDLNPLMGHPDLDPYGKVRMDSWSPALSLSSLILNLYTIYTEMLENESMLQNESMLETISQEPSIDKEKSDSNNNTNI